MTTQHLSRTWGRLRTLLLVVGGVTTTAPGWAGIATWATPTPTPSVTAPPASSASFLKAPSSGLAVSSQAPVVCQNNVKAAQASYSALKNAETYASQQIRQPSGIGGCLQNILGMNFSLGYVGVGQFIDQAMQALENMACGAAQQEWQSQVGSRLPGVGQNWNVPVVGNVGGFSGTQTSGGGAGYQGNLSTSGGSTNFNTGSVGGNLFPSGSAPGTVPGGPSSGGSPFGPSPSPSTTKSSGGLF